MYKKNYLSLYNDDKEIKFPNWLIREIGTIKTNIKWNGNNIKVNDKNVFLTFRWYDNKAVIGNFTYIITQYTSVNFTDRHFWRLMPDPR